VNLLMVSDHGFGKKENAFYINNWLAKEGFLKKSTAKEMKMTKEGAAFSARRKHAKGKTIDVTRLSVLLEIPIISTLLHKPYRKLRRFLPFSTVDNRTIDPAETEAFCTTSASWGIYINETDRFLGGCVEEESKGILLANLEEKLRGLKDPKTGENVLKEVFRKEEIYRGRRLSKAPDLILIPNDGWTFIASLTARDIFESRERSEHDVEGIFTAFGPDIVEGGKAGKLFMQDIAPTVLHMFGGPVYEYMDGKVRLEIFKDSSEFRSREVEYSEDTEAFIRKQPGAI